MEKRAFGDGQRGTPLVSQDIQAYAAVGVDVGMVDARSEGDLGRLERVIGGEVDVEEEDAAGIRALSLLQSSQSLRTRTMYLRVEKQSRNTISSRTGPMIVACQ